MPDTLPGVAGDVPPAHELQLPQPSEAAKVRQVVALDVQLQAREV